jgi:hypothetical protein
MKQNVEKALEEVDLSYAELIHFANEVIDSTCADTEAIISQVNDNIESITNDKIRDFMTRLSLCAYSLSEIKERAAFKASLAETIRKQKYALKFNEATGTVGAKDNIALLETSSEILVDEIHSLISSMLKTKLDCVYRLINTLSTVLTTRMTEARLSADSLC